MFVRSLFYLLTLLCIAIHTPNPLCAVDLSFKITMEKGPAASGRLIVFLIRSDSSRLKNRMPVDGPFWDEPQPLFGINASLSPGSSVSINDTADCFPMVPSKLSVGRYRAQARFDTKRLNSDWRREPNNIWSDVVEFEIVATREQKIVELTLKNLVEVENNKQVQGVDWFETKSALLTGFRGVDVVLQAGVVFPSEYQSGKKYPVIYEVPGFGDDHSSAASGRSRIGAGPSAELAKHSFRVVLNPEGPNGHTLFADSANNGPCGEALIRELIPALEAKYAMIANPTARVLRGHSSGGWSTLWLAMKYPDTFGAAWSSAPDPVDFRRFQKVNIYAQPNFYTDANGQDLPSLRRQDKVQMTIRQEARGEDVLGPDNSSGQQWDSWFAAFGPRNDSGNPVALFDPQSGNIQRTVAGSYRSYDLCQLLLSDPQRYLPIFRNRIRLVCGTEDSFYLNEAVELLDAEIRRLGRETSDRGYVKLVPGDHGTVMANDAMKAFPSEVLEHFREFSHIDKQP
ncbi:MAG: alpha/beta hydrolase-fold protein [Pirellula sp.]